MSLTYDTNRYWCIEFCRTDTNGRWEIHVHRKATDWRKPSDFSKNWAIGLLR